jgi:non-ribosomal peptide synthetase component F
MSVLDFERTGRERSDSAAKAWLRALSATAPIAAHPRRTLPTVIDELAERHGAAPALLCEHEILTYQELAARANRYARAGRCSTASRTATPFASSCRTALNIWRSGSE